MFFISNSLLLPPPPPPHLTSTPSLRPSAPPSLHMLQSRWNKNHLGALPVFHRFSIILPHKIHKLNPKLNSIRTWEPIPSAVRLLSFIYIYNLYIFFLYIKFLYKKCQQSVFCRRQVHETLTSKLTPKQAIPRSTRWSGERSRCQRFPPSNHCLVRARTKSSSTAQRR